MCEWRHLLLASVCCMVGAGQVAAQDVQSAQGDDVQLRQGASSQTISDDVILVTARRRAEDAQSVPVSVQAFSGEELSNRGIQNTDDLQKLVPGVVFTGAGGPITTTYFIRGQGRDVIGSALPSVINYLNDVPLTPSSSRLPTFDMASIQVLKGPQGTLFGRNTTGGAVLATSAPPVHELEGYVQGLYGSYDWVDVEGAFNLPLVQDVIALRVAGQLTRRDGYTKEQFGPDDKDDRHEDAFRISLLIEPTDWLRNVTVFDYFKHRSGHAGIIPTGDYLVGFLPYRQGLAPLAFGPELGGLIADAFDCNTDISCNIDLQIQRQVAGGIRKSWHDAPSEARQKVWGLSNTTEFDLGPVLVKNIFGYRTQEWIQNTDSDGTTLPLLNTYNFQNEYQITNELQFSGQLFDGRLDWLVGAFYLFNKPDGPYGAKFDIYRPSQIPQDNWPLSTVQNAFYKDESKAAFLSLGYNFTGALEGVRLNGAIRHTRDKEQACSLTTAPFSLDPIDGWDACLQTPGSSTVSAKFRKTTWQLGVDWQVNDSVFAYVVARTGYRAGQLNTPQLGPALADLQAFGPQSVLDFEAGLKTEWRMGSVDGRLNIAAFRTKIDDYQRIIQGLPPGLDGDNNPLNDPSFTIIVINGGTAVLKGIEVDGFIRPMQDLTLSFAGSYISPKFTELISPPILAGLAGTSGTFDKTPKWSFSANLDYRLPIDSNIGEFFVTGTYYWVDDYFAGLAVFDSYDTLDATLQWRDMFGHPLTGTVFVNNLTNKKYESFSALTGNSPGYRTSVYGMPRMFGVRLRYDFGGER